MNFKVHSFQFQWYTKVMHKVTIKHKDFRFDKKINIIL